MYFEIIWEMLDGEHIFSLGCSAASEFSEWVQVMFDVYILHRKYHFSEILMEAAIRRKISMRLY